MIIPTLFAAVVGFGHAFEADHLVAVSSIVTKRDRFWLAVKDGIFWGLGHTSTVLLVGAIIILGSLMVDEIFFHYLEAAVGVMLLLLGVLRLRSVLKYKDSHNETELIKHDHSHHEAYGVGMIHGLAGSGVMVLLVMTEIKDPGLSIIYLLVFGLGSVVGMLLASGIFSLPFSQLFTKNQFVRISLIIISSLLCLFFGGRIVYENILN